MTMNARFGTPAQRSQNNKQNHSQLGPGASHMPMFTGPHDALKRISRSGGSGIIENALFRFYRFIGSDRTADCAVIAKIQNEGISADG